MNRIVFAIPRVVFFLTPEDDHFFITVKFERSRPCLHSCFLFHLSVSLWTVRATRAAAPELLHTC